MSKSRIDPFTRRRLEKFVNEFRGHDGVLPTLADFAAAGFDKSKIDEAVKDEIIVELYVKLTNGSTVKGYKLYVAPIV